MAKLTPAGVQPPRKTRGEVVARSPLPLDKWPTPAAALLEALDQVKLLTGYVHRKQAVEYYVEGRKGQYILEKTHISITKAKRLFERCTAQRADGSIAGFYACLPNESQSTATKHSRHRPFDPALAAKGSGLKRRFRELIEKDRGRIQKLLEDFFRTRSVNGRAPSPVLTQSIVFRGFLQICRDVGIKDDEYPFDQLRKGEWGITNFWKLWMASHPQQAANNQYGPDAAKEQAVDMAAAACSELPPLPRPDAYARVELDEHLLHAIGLLRVPCRSGPPIVIGTRRVWGLLLRETASGPILSTGVSYREKYDKNDILRLVRKALKPPGRMEHPSLPGLEYLPGAAFPGEQGFKMHRWQVLAFDADSSHLSIAEIEDLRKLIGEIENERVGQPTAHPYAESINARVAKFFEAMPTGTGSNPEDPARRDPEAAAQKYCADVTLLEEILDVLGRNFNVTSQKSLDGRTPLQHLKALAVEGKVFTSTADAFGDFELYKLLPRYGADITFSRGTNKRVGALGVTLHGAWYTSRAFAKEPLLRAATDLRCTVYMEDDARYAWVVPHALPKKAFFLKVTNRDLKDFVHSLEWRRLTEAHGTNMAYEAEESKASTLFGVLEGLALRAKDGDAGAAVAVAQLMGLAAQAHNGLLHYVSTAEQRAALDAERPSSDSSDAPAPSGEGRAADQSQGAQEEGPAPPPAAPPKEGIKAPVNPLPLQGQTPRRPLTSNRNPFGLKKS